MNMVRFGKAFPNLCKMTRKIPRLLLKKSRMKVE